MDEMYGTYEVVKRLSKANHQHLGDFATFDEAYDYAIKNDGSYIVKITPIWLHEEIIDYDYETVWDCLN